MAIRIMESQLRAALNTDSHLVEYRVIALSLEPSGVAVEREGARVGSWNWSNGRFEFHAGRKTSIEAVETVAEAVRLTREKVEGR